MSEKIVQFNEEIIKSQIKELIRHSVEETFNELLDAEAESLTQATWYERTNQHQGYCTALTSAILPLRPGRNPRNSQAQRGFLSNGHLNELNQKAYVYIEKWQNRSLQGRRYSYVYVDGIYLRCS